MTELVQVFMTGDRSLSRNDGNEAILKFSGIRNIYIHCQLQRDFITVQRLNDQWLIDEAAIKALDCRSDRGV